MYTCRVIDAYTLLIIAPASLVFSRFGTGYDLFIDNCQHFTQLLTEVIRGKESREVTRQFFEKRSVMKFPVAASWLVAPVYGCTKVLHHALKPEDPTEVSNVHQNVGLVLDHMENFILHPRVFAARRRQRIFS